MLVIASGIDLAMPIENHSYLHYRGAVLYKRNSIRCEWLSLAYSGATQALTHNLTQAIMYVSTN